MTDKTTKTPIPKNLPMYEVDPPVIRFKLQKVMPYLATAIYRMRAVKMPGEGTFSCDANWTWYYSEKVPFTPEQQVTALFHELSHLLRNHFGRKGDREPFKWNLAGDAEINDWFPSSFDVPDIIFKPKDIPMPEDLLAEEYFEQIKVEYIKVRSLGHGECGGAAGQPQPHEGKDGEGKEIPGISEVEAEAVRSEVANQIENSNGQQPGTIPAGMARWAHELLNPQVPWTKVLRQYVRRSVTTVMGTTDQTWNKPSRRSYDPFLLPKRISKRPIPAFYVDTSGSISEQLLREAMTEVRAAVKAQCSMLYVTAVDAAIHQSYRVSTVGEVQRLKMGGGGGTDMRLCFSHAKTLRPRPNLLVVLTDGYTPWPDDKPNFCETIVVLTQAGDSPEWARTLRIKSDE